MKWIDKELGNFWWNSETTQISSKQKYKLFIDIIDDWNNISKLLKDIHNLGIYSFYTGCIIHDGNRSSGALRSYIVDYEAGGRLLETEGWHTAQSMLQFIRQAEVLIDLYNISKE